MYVFFIHAFNLTLFLHEIFKLPAPVTHNTVSF